ncbi:magnesium-dependent phosphatase-1 [Infundibulicybe gibba]|nr:magnesium-dependent phosphatase-1 [Infundibulicybe gibba]
MSNRFPALVAFDLDYTLWNLWIDTHVTGPLRRKKETVNEVLDKYDESICFYKDVPDVLHRLRAAGITIAACSRTSAPKLARDALRLLLVKPKTGSDASIPAIEFFDEMEIYPGSKLTHFKKLHEKTGIPYSEMLFFDDESRNREVEKLGVTFILTPRGLNNEAFEKGLNEWRRRYPQEVAGGDT